MNTMIALLLSVTVLAVSPRNDPYFQITIVDEATGRGVPLIELRTVNDLTYYTDSAGVVAFQEPGWMDQEVFFHVRGHGYELPPDGFGFHGRKLTTEAGGSAVVKVRRINIAERLYRVTGAGIYVESQRVGQVAPFRLAPLNAQVVGSDSVQAAVFRGQIHWFWGDTNRPAYPLGNFHAPGATSQLPGDGGIDPNVGVELNYFVGPDGFAKPTCKMPGEGPTWIDGLAVVKDAENRERLFAHYLKVKPPLTVYQQGLAEFLPEKQEFESRVIFPDDSVVLPSGHSFTYSADGVEYIQFAKPFSVVRVRATAEAVLDPAQYEAFSCLTVGSRAVDLTLDRDARGEVRYDWKRNTPPMTPDLQQKLVAAGRLKPGECLFQVRNVETNKPVRIHNGSVNWNEFRRKWVLIASESSGTSRLGEVWYAEADTPLGPWAYARKIVTHDKQSFYNPRHHPFFNQQAGRVLFFEGTYTHTFSGNEERTPRYEYNQIMYRLDLSDPRLTLPLAVYRRPSDRGERLTLGAGNVADPTFRNVAFFACNRPFPNSIPVFIQDTENGGILSTANPVAAKIPPLFHALPPDLESPPPVCVPLFEQTGKNGQKQYVVGKTAVPGFDRADRPLCYVWPVPST